MDVDELAVACGPVFVGELSGMPVNVAHERLRPRVRHLHRAAGAQREHARMRLNGKIFSGAKRAPDAGHRQTHLLWWERQARGQLVAIDVQPLCGDVKVDAAIASRDRKARLGPKRSLVLHANLVLPPHHHVRSRALVAVPDLHVPRDVSVWMQPGRRIAECQLGIGQRLEHLVLHADLLRRAAGALRMIGGNQGHRLTPVADDIDREHRLVLDLEAVHLSAGHVPVREHGLHAGQCERFRRVDGDDARVRVWAAHRRPPQHPVDGKVRRVREGAADLERPVRPLRRVADTSTHGVIRLAARCTASMILA